MRHEVDDAVGSVLKARSPDLHRVWKSVLRRAVSRIVARRILGVLLAIPCGFSGADVVVAQELLIPGEGFSTLQFSAAGELSQLLWKDEVLVYRTRQADGTWSEESVTTNPIMGPSVVR